MLVCSALFYVAEGARAAVLENDTLRVDWAPAMAAPGELLVRADTGPEGRWFDLMTRAEGRVMSRHFALDGPGLTGAVWQEAAAGQGIAMRAMSQDGRLEIERRLVAGDAPYRMNLQIAVRNVSSDEIGTDGWSLVLGPGLGEYPVPGFGIAEGLYVFVHPVLAEAGTVALEEGEEQGMALEETPRWLGLHSRYFALLVEPLQRAGAAKMFTAAGSDGLPGSFLPQLQIDPGIGRVAPGATVTREFAIFAGPKSRAALAADAGKGDYSDLLFQDLWSWMRWLCLGLLWLLEAIHGFVPSWGVAIMLLAVAVRIVLFPLARRAFASQVQFAALQSRLQPELQEIKRNYRGEEQSERILALYERHGVSPLAGLKPLLIVLIQIPIFVALFHVLGQAYELRDASFLWMETLAEPDRLFSFGADLPFFGAWFNLLPILLGITTLITIRAAPAPAPGESAGRRQDLMLAVMAVVFVLLFYPFPSGMVLYWTAANLLHLAQQLAGPALPATSRSGDDIGLH